MGDANSDYCRRCGARIFASHSGLCTICYNDKYVKLRAEVERLRGEVHEVWEDYVGRDGLNEDELLALLGRLYRINARAAVKER